MKNTLGNGPGGSNTGGAATGAGKAKNMLGAAGAGASVMDGFFMVSPSLIMIGPGSAAGKTIGAGGGHGLTLTSRLGAGPAGMTSGGTLQFFDGNWTTKGPSAGGGAMTTPGGAGTSRVVAMVGGGAGIGKDGGGNGAAGAGRLTPTVGGNGAAGAGGITPAVGGNPFRRASMYGSNAGLSPAGGGQGTAGA